MSFEYNQYLEKHIGNVRKAYMWLKTYLPMVTAEIPQDHEFFICNCHDDSKYDLEEYEAYDEYFYGKNDERASEVKSAFNYAWLHHIHSNPHHWQHWVLLNDEPSEGTVALDMPYRYIIEMICDWWSFSWNKGELTEIFKWYEKHKQHMKLSDKTRDTVEDILSKIEDKLDELESEGDEE